MWYIITCVTEKLAGVAQLVEQLICNQQVGGSSPSTSSSKRNELNRFGSVPKWPKGADCKSVVSDFGGSNPPAPTKQRDLLRQVFFVSSIGKAMAYCHALACIKKLSQ